MPQHQHPSGPPTVLVAGATGLIGRAVSALLRQQGATIRTFSNSPARAAALRGISDVRTGDATDRRSLSGVFDGIDVVLSCLGAPAAFGWERRSFRDVDTVANCHLVQAAEDAGVRRFVYVSVHVEDAYRDTAYVQAHEEVVEALQRSRLSAGIVRCTGLFPSFAPLLPMARRGVIAIPGDGQSLTNPVHPLDVAEACARVLRGDVDEISIGGPDVLTRDDIARLAFAAVGRTPRVLHLPTAVMATAARMIRPFHPHHGELLEFAARAFTSRCVAPERGTRRLEDYFAAAARGAGVGVAG